jgi:hypothetical protein
MLISKQFSTLREVLQVRFTSKHKDYEGLEFTVCSAAPATQTILAWTEFQCRAQDQVKGGVL